MDFNHTIFSNKNGWKYGGFGKEIGEAIERTPANVEENLGASLPNAPMSLKICDVGFKFQLKMLEFIDPMNEELQVGKDVRSRYDKMVEPS
jgi:hypothetical protein